MEFEESIRREPAPEEKPRKVAIVGGGIPAGLMGALMATMFVDEMRHASIFDETPRVHTDPIKEVARAERARVEIEGHQTRMQAAEDKRRRKAELRKKHV